MTPTKHCVVLLGPPGVGKGTQAELIAQATGLEALSTGDLLRQAVAQGTSLGKKAQAIMARGDLVDDATMVGIVEARLDAITSVGVMLDGFPRTLAQAEALDSALAARGMRVDAALSFAADSKAVVARIAGRRAETTAPARADDADPAAIERRLALYEASAAPLKNHYAKASRLYSVDATPAPDVVTDLALAALSQAGLDVSAQTR